MSLLIEDDPLFDTMMKTFHQMLELFDQSPPPPIETWMRVADHADYLSNLWFEQLDLRHQLGKQA